MENFFSYGIVDLLVWAGIGDLVDALPHEDPEAPAHRARRRRRAARRLRGALHLPVAAPAWSPSRRTGARTSTWRTSSSTSRLTPTSRRSALLDFLAAGEAPIYVGFGSVVAEDPAALTPHHLHRAREGGRARHRIGGLGAPGRRGAAAERLRDRRRSARLAVRALPGGLPSRRRRDHLRGPARRAADGGGAVLRRPVLLGAGRRGCRGGPGADSRSAGSPARRSPRPSTPAGARRCASGRASSARRLRATDGVELAVRVDRAPSSRARHVLLARTRTIWPSSTATRAASASAGTAARTGPRGARGTPVPLCRLGRAVRRTDSRASWAS